RDTTANLIGRIDAKTMVIVPEKSAALPDLPEGVEGHVRDDGALEFTYRTTQVPAEAVLAAVRKAGIAIRDVKTQEANLEDVFLSLTAWAHGRG
ncbi:MAG: DUF4162 domain-containing protein, partial [Marivivens sp.]